MIPWLWGCDICGLSFTHWGRVTHLCVSRLTITGSDNGLSPGWRQAIIWTNAEILLIGSLGTNFSENLIEILTFSFTKMQLKVSSAKWRPFCLSLNELSEFSLTHLISSMGVQSSTELQRLDCMTLYQVRSPNNDCQVTCPFRENHGHLHRTTSELLLMGTHKVKHVDGILSDIDRIITDI